MSSWQNHYFQRGVSHGAQDGLERSFILYLDLSSESSDAYLLCLLLLLHLLLCDSLWVNLCWSLSRVSSLSLALQHILKWFCFHTWNIFCPMLGILSVDEMCCICCMSYLGHPWLYGHYLFKTWMSWSHQSSLIWPTFWLQNVLLHEKATLSYDHFLSFSLELASFYQIFYVLI